MPEPNAQKSPVNVLVHSLTDAAEIVSEMSARGWHTTTSNDLEKTVTLLESAQHTMLFVVDSAGTGIVPVNLLAEQGIVHIAIDSKLDSLPNDEFDYSFHWSSDPERNNNHLAHCDRLAELKGELAKATYHSRFFIEAGHQLKSPVAVMKEFTHLLKEGVGGDLTGKQGQYVQVIDDNINRLLKLLENVEALGSLDFNGWSIKLEELDGHKIMDQVASSWSTMVAAKGLVLNVTHPQGPLAVRADISAVEQILFNLIDNATKYCAAEGTITLECNATAGSVIFGVANDGAAIPLDLQESIFDPFHRMPDHAAAPGIGLGLTIARKLAVAMQAELYLDANFTSGARFLLSIPLNQQNPG